MKDILTLVFGIVIGVALYPVAKAAIGEWINRIKK
tara:strand:- start:1077 stop:1181 length:105 start_codon:yes stop_codon:yes gene_type:complete